MASLRSRSPTCGNSSTPDGARKHLKPSTPAAASDSSSPAFPGTTPPQKKTSISHFPAAAARFSASGAAGLVHVHVRVHEPRQQVGITDIEDSGHSPCLPREQDRADAPLSHAHDGILHP